MPRWTNPVLFISLLLPSAAFCETVNIGFVSHDVFTYPDFHTSGVNYLNILNFTGGFAQPPNFPILDPLILLNGSFTINSGPPPWTIPLDPLGDIGPGILGPTELLKFSEWTAFETVIFTATLSQTRFRLSDGRTFVANSPNVTAVLRRDENDPDMFSRLGSALVTVSNVPEPGTAFLLGPALAILIGFRIGRQRPARRNPTN
jgi:hypothetical protein